MVGTSSHKLKVPGFDSWSGHMPGLQVQFPGACKRQPIDVSLSHECFFLSLFPSPSLSLKSINMSSGEDKEKKKVIQRDIGNCAKMMMIASKFIIAKN